MKLDLLAIPAFLQRPSPFKTAAEYVASLPATAERKQVAPRQWVMPAARDSMEKSPEQLNALVFLGYSQETVSKISRREADRIWAGAIRPRDYVQQREDMYDRFAVLAQQNKMKKESKMSKENGEAAVASVEEPQVDRGVVVQRKGAMKKAKAPKKAKAVKKAAAPKEKTAKKERKLKINPDLQIESEPREGSAKAKVLALLNGKHTVGEIASSTKLKVAQVKLQIWLLKTRHGRKITVGGTGKVSID